MPPPDTDPRTLDPPAAPPRAGLPKDRLRAALAVLLVGAVVVRGIFREPEPPMPAKMALTSATPWMADALPGVGPQRKEAVARMLQAGRLDDLPATARPHVPDLFLCATP